MGTVFAQTAVSSNSEVQIEKNSNNTEDGYAYYNLDYSGDKKNISDTSASYVVDQEKGYVKTSKTITPTENENEFEIKLEVTTTENFHELNLSDDAAVVLVLDCSGSMQWDLENGGYCNRDGCDNKDKYVKEGSDPWNHIWGDPSRFQMMSESLLGNKTSKGFLADFADTKDAQRMVSVVYFGQKVNPEKTVGWTDITDSEGLEQIKNAVSFETLKSDIWSQTSQGAGLAAAIDLLENDSAINGIPNRYVVLLTDGRPEGPHPDGKYAEEQAEIIKEDCNALLYAIGFGTKNITLLRDDKKPVNKWLEEDISSPNCFVAAQSGEELDLGLSDIAQTIRNASNAWKVTDPMGENIVFGGFVKTDSSATFSDGNIEWDLKKSIPVENGDGTSEYSLSYKIRLDNSAKGFSPEKYYSTNGYTSVSYFFVEDILQGGKVIVSNKDAIKEHGFNVPAVSGYLSNIKIEKIEELESGEYHYLEGAEFQLSHKAGDCSVCKGEVQNISTFTGTTDSNGILEFSNIPSGHEYTLRESVAPDGYKKIEKNYDVKVDYGVVSVDGKKLGETDSIVIKNVPFDPTTVTLSGVKTLDGKTPSSNEYEFQLTKVNADNTTELLQTVNNDGSIFTFDALTFDKVGSYSYVVTELKGDSKDIIYDSIKYQVVINISKDYQLEEYVADVVITELDNPDNLYQEIIFNNVSRTPVEEQIVAKKLLDGKTPQTNEFEFELLQDNKVIQTVNNDGSKVTFDKIKFEKSGKYNFVIREVSGKNPDVIYDNTEYGAEVIVEPDVNGNGYIAKVIYVNEDGNEVDEAIFNNMSRTPVTAEVKAVKLLDGKTPQTNDFEFVLLQNNKVIQTVNNNGNKVSFEKIVFDKAGEYDFVVKEVVGQNPDVIYDSTVYSVKVIVEPDANSNGYITQVIYTNEMGNEVETAVFNNISRTPAEIDIHATKYVDGKFAEGSDFEFILYEKDSNGDFVQIGKVKNNGKDIDFAGIKFDKAGKYEFKVEEVYGDKKDIDYDRSSYYITIDVCPDEETNGYITRMLIIKDGGAGYEEYNDEIIVFNNKTIELPPVTGDRSNLQFWMNTLLMTLTMIGCINVRHKRRESK